ncbi:MAG: SPOR domain-containing protein [Mangrovibacterium sp.]
MEILAYIEELLLLNDCVIIPQFGGFVSNYKPATIAGNSFAPPSHSVSFNSKLNFNDGLLINYVSAEENISYHSAKRKVETLVAEMNYRLGDGEQIVISAIGSLQYDAHHQVVFTPAENANLNVDTYGLNGFNYHSLLHEKLSSTVSKHINAQPIQRASKSKNFRRALWATPVLIALLAIPFHDEIPNLQESSLLHWNKTETPVVAETPTEETPQVVEEVEVEPMLNTIAAEEPAPIVEPAAPVNRYHLIVGSFRDATNANDLVEELRAQGLDANNLGVIRGLNYVAAASFPNLEEAKKAQLSFAQNHPSIAGVWLYTDAR